MKLRIVCIADTHALHRELIVPPGDLLIHAGDFTFFSQDRFQIRDFNRWLGELPHRYKVVIPGNHEFAFEADPKLRREMTNAVFLVEEGVELLGQKIWGSPMTPHYGGAFGRSRPEDRARAYAQIPGDVDILVTHGPPLGILDLRPGSEQGAGCQQLRDAVDRIKARVHVFGHIHGAHGTHATEHTMFVNATLLGESGDLDRNPIVLDITKNQRGMDVSTVR